MSQADRLFRKAEIEAEALIGIARMTVATILAFAAFLLVAQQGMPTEAEGIRGLRIATFVLGSYFSLGAFSVLVVRLGFYRTWIAWTLAFAEIILISLNIYVAMTVAGASSLTALASPAGYLLAVFLVLQTLRYRLIFQITTSLLLIIAVIIILLTAPGQSDGPSEQTLRYLAATYAGIPNFIRVIMLILVTAIAALSVWRGRLLLNDIALETEIRVNQTRFMPDELSDQMTDGDIERLRAGRLAELAIMFVDIRGFTAMSEAMSPADISAFLGVFRSRITEAAAAYGGVVDKFIGDGALIVFGLDGDIEKAAKGAISAGRESLQKLLAWNETRETKDRQAVRVVIAIHTGEVIVGAIGDERRLEFSILGSPVNEASRIEAVAKDKDATMVVSARVLECAKTHLDTNEWRPLGNISLRGSSKTTALYAWR